MSLPKSVRALTPRPQPSLMTDMKVTQNRSKHRPFTFLFSAILPFAWGGAAAAKA